MTAFLFGRPGNLVDRHPGKAMVGLLLLISSVDWLTDTIARWFA